jgi:5-methylcytosine-specific restriction protein A
MIATPCSHFGCPRLAVRSRGRSRGKCELHLKANEEERNSQPARRAAKLFYASPYWRTTRARFLAAHPICSKPDCSAPSTTVDHIIARARGGTEDWSNLEAYCKAHHSAKGARMDGLFGNPLR